MDSYPWQLRQVVENVGVGQPNPGGVPQQATMLDAERLFHLLADQHSISLDQVAVNQATANQQIWERMAQYLPSAAAIGTPPSPTLAPLGIRAQKMTPDDDPEAHLNAFERTAVAAGWRAQQWSTILIPCLIGPAQQAVNALPLSDQPEFQVRKAILQVLNINP